MKRLSMLLIVSALMAGGSALASAQEYHENGFSLQIRLGDHDRDHDRYVRYDDDHEGRRHFYRDRDDRRRRDDDHRYRGWNDADDRR